MSQVYEALRVGERTLWRGLCVAKAMGWAMFKRRSILFGEVWELVDYHEQEDGSWHGTYLSADEAQDVMKLLLKERIQASEGKAQSAPAPTPPPRFMLEMDGNMVEALSAAILMSKYTTSGEKAFMMAAAIVVNRIGQDEFHASMQKLSKMAAAHILTLNETEKADV